MANPPYSTRFLRVASAGSWWDYHVPTDKRASIKGITAINGGSSPGRVFVTVAGTYILIATLQATSSLVVQPWFVVAYGGEVIQAQMEAPLSGVTVSGFLLDAPLGAQEEPPMSQGEPPVPDLSRVPAPRRRRALVSCIAST